MSLTVRISMKNGIPFFLLLQVRCTLLFFYYKRTGKLVLTLMLSDNTRNDKSIPITTDHLQQPWVREPTTTDHT